jgi:tetratricopeptide (TPR) repeat protein
VAETVRGESESPLRFTVDYERARLAEFEHREPEANNVYSAMLDQLAGRADNGMLRITALMNRGSNKGKLGDTAGGVADLTAARDDWARCGCRIDSADAQVKLAEVLLGAGDVAAAGALLDSAEAVLPPGISQYRVILLTVRAKLCELLGDWPAAARRYQQALDVATARRDQVRRASLLRKLADVHAELSQSQTAAEYAERAAEADRQLAAADDSNVPADQLRAESENGKGIRSFCDTGDWATALDRARQFFVSAADLDPDNFWPLLNLSFSYAWQEDWQGASETLGQVLDRGPALMRTARLYRCLRDYVLEYARGLLRRKEAHRAAAVMSEVLERLSGKLPAAELASARAICSVALAAAGEAAAAREACREALVLADPGRSLAETVAPLIDEADVYWTMDATLEEVQDEPGASPALRERTIEARAQLGFRLDELLGLTPDPSAAQMPVVTPVAVEVGYALVPFVDSTQDRGVFLYELIPAMRERILAATGVTVPGVRMRGATLPPYGYRVLIDEVPVLSGSVPGGAATAPPPGEESREPVEEFADLWPLTGAQAAWALAECTGYHPDGAAVLTLAQHLIYRMELVIRTYLVRFFGPQEVSMLVETWAMQDDENLVPAVLPDADARLLLTWILQRLVEDGVPITDWRAVLTAVRDAGGITAPQRTLCSAVRARLRDRLPGTQSGRKTVQVPAEYEAWLLSRTPAGPEPPPFSPRHEFQRWLHQAVADSGPAITLVTGDQDAREVISAIARTECRLIATVSRDELRSP